MCSDNIPENQLTKNEYNLVRDKKGESMTHLLKRV